MSNYLEMNKALKALIKDVKYDITILSNASALLNEYLDNINWVGFYLCDNKALYLGPFQGKTACMYIPFDKGICGECATKEETILVQNVHERKNHIACDSRSNSEICIPIFKGGKLYGLLDIDSPLIGRFTLDDKSNLEESVRIIEDNLN